MNDFDTFWLEKVIPLQGKTVETLDRKVKNKITSVTADYLERKSSNSANSKKLKISKTIFQEIFVWLKKKRF